MPAPSRRLNNDLIILNFFTFPIGNVRVPVANCDEKYYNVQKKSDTLLSDYLKYWQDYTSKSHSDLPCLYLKVCLHIIALVYLHFHLNNTFLTLILYSCF
jgi:hypothetical protein